jgi:hypothetical protein
MRLVEALEQLYKAREYVIEGEKCLSEQRKIVDLLDREGGDPLDAILFLEELENMQNEYVAHRDRLEKQVLTIVKPEW